MERYKTARQFLEAARDAKIERLRCEARLEEIFTECRRTTTHLGGVGGGSGTSDPHKDRAWTAYADLKSVLEEQYTAATELEAAGEKFLRGLQDVQHRAVLSLRYLAAKSWRKVEESLKLVGIFYEERNVYNLHNEALAAAEILWEVQRQ